jgi:anti-sigma factor RsiW
MSELFQRVRFRRDHRWAPGYMSAYLDKELASSRRARMERHATDCPECHRLLSGLRVLVGALQRLPSPAGGTDQLALASSVRLRLREPAAPE